MKNSFLFIFVAAVAVAACAPGTISVDINATGQCSDSLPDGAPITMWPPPAFDFVCSGQVTDSFDASVAETSTPDTSVDAPVEASADTSVDAPVEASFEAAADSGSDVLTHDAAADVGVDAFTDTGVDASPDTGTDTGAAEASSDPCAGYLPAGGTWDLTSVSPVVDTQPNVGYVHTGQSTMILVDPFVSSTVWLGTGNDGVWRSDKCGAAGTWRLASTGLNGPANAGNAGVPGLNESVPWSMAIDPTVPGVLYAVGAYGAESVWKSTDYGVDWTDVMGGINVWSLVPYGFIGTISIDPTNHLHLVATSHGQCNSFPQGCYFETLDGASTWAGPTGLPSQWQEKAGILIATGNTWIYGTGEANGGSWVTSNAGATWTLAPVNASGNQENGTLIQASDGAYYTGSFAGLLRSTDGLSWTLPWSATSTQAVTGIAASATTLFGSDHESYWSAPLTQITNISTMTAPSTLDGNAFAEFLAYDQNHHLLYSSTWADGVFRIVVQ